MRFLKNTNWSLLKKQKETLVELSSAHVALSAEAKADLAGLLHFLDAVMDDAAEILGEQVVFPGLGEEEECRMPDCAETVSAVVDITISGGAVQYVESPPGVKVVIRDYDVDGADGEDFDIRKDESGDSYQHWEYFRKV